MAIKKWFVQRRKSKVLDIADRQITLAIGTVIELEKTLKAALNGNKEEARSSFERLSLVEHEIDELRRAVFEELTRGSMPSKDREDIMHLVKRLDMMADQVKDSGRTVMVLLDTKIPPEMWKKFVEISEDLVVCATALREAIEKLGTDPSEIKGIINKIDKIEEKVDQKYLKTKSLFIRYTDKIDSAALILLSDLLESMEQVADSCDDTADYVRILTVAREVA